MGDVCSTASGRDSIEIPVLVGRPPASAASPAGSRVPPATARAPQGTASASAAASRATSAGPTAPATSRTIPSTPQAPLTSRPSPARPQATPTASKTSASGGFGPAAAGRGAGAGFPAPSWQELGLYSAPSTARSVQADVQAKKFVSKRFVPDPMNRFWSAFSPQLEKLDRLWTASDAELGYLCKAPLAFAKAGVAGTEGLARSAVEVTYRSLSTEGRGRICPPACAKGGHLQMPWFWVCWAAAELRQDDIAEACFKKISTFSHPFTSSGLVRKPHHSFTDFEADFFATAVLCKAALLCKSTASAVAAGDSLLRALEANGENMRARRRFCMRWNFHDGLLDKDDKFYCLSQDKPDQLYYLVGLPAAVLFELSKADVQSAGAYRQGAHKLMQFLQGCRGLFSSQASHVVAYAAALAKDTPLMIRITQNVVEEGRMENKTLDEMEAIDQAAETMIWLCEANKL